MEDIITMPHNDDGLYINLFRTEVVVEEPTNLNTTHSTYIGLGGMVRLAVDDIR